MATRPPRTSGSPTAPGLLPRLFLLLLLLLLLLGPLGPIGCEVIAPGQVLDLPARADDALSGPEVSRDIREMELEEREERIYQEVRSGNVPGWLRPFERVELSGEVDGRTREIAFWVIPDYLAVGSDDESFMVPLSPGMGHRIASELGASLPTPRMVDAIWRSARVRLAPIRLPADEEMHTVEAFERHHRLVWAQRWLNRSPPGLFAAGHKLDVTLLITAEDENVHAGVYGWHRQTGEPIQPVFAIQMESWPAFNQGIRLVDRCIEVDGERMDLADALRDPGLAPLLWDGGVSEEAGERAEIPFVPWSCGP